MTVTIKWHYKQLHSVGRGNSSHTKCGVSVRIAIYRKTVRDRQILIVALQRATLCYLVTASTLSQQLLVFAVGRVPWSCFKVLIKKPSKIDFYPLNIVSNFWTIDSRIVTICTVGSHVKQTILWNYHWKNPHDLPRIKVRTVSLSPAFLLMRGISSQVSNLYLNNFYSYLMTLYSSLFHHNKRIKAKLHLY